jgi:hypothetical protein
VDRRPPDRRARRREWRVALTAIGIGLLVLATGTTVVLTLRPFHTAPDPTAGGEGMLGTVDGNGSALPASGSASASASATTPSAASSAPVTSAPADDPPPPSYPSTVDAYAQAALTAWLARDSTRVGQLAAPIAINEMGQAPAGLPGGWEPYDCWYEPFAPCRQLRNDRGDVFSVSVDTAKLGQAKAVVRAYVDVVAYPASALEYVKYTLDAWSGGNTERVADLLGGTGASWFFIREPAPGGRNGFKNYVEYTSSAGNTCVQADLDSPQSASSSWRLDPGKLGGPHALIWAGYGYDDASGIC